MTGLAVLIPIALGLGLAGLAAFFWAMKHDQFEDLDGAALRILNEDEDEVAARPEARPSRRPSRDHGKASIEQREM
ncbi:cbb3-type cytochrome oxidase assembly protein CcoS [Pacificimonas sp. WHA3]|uniref:Cbb3-type cytochrome oxidase assembly protein CcoS n=1 Tax=Pacificimonas pallii TaxID=2827236 RepID=A0ABS6SGN0_9SPHN|nr:cbb3-type cytochrome oxidase assembly protein CcoS [Pacificimonas pallii]